MKAKIVAAERRTTLRELVMHGLKLVTGTPPDTNERKRNTELRRLLRAMQAGNTEPMIPMKREENYDC